VVLTATERRSDLRIGASKDWGISVAQQTGLEMLSHDPQSALFVRFALERR
jgi:hypothetical protein